MTKPITDFLNEQLGPKKEIRNWDSHEMLVLWNADGSCTVEPVNLESYEAFVRSMYSEDPETFAARIHEVTVRSRAEEREWKKDAQAKLDDVRKELAAKIGEEIREDQLRAAKRDREIGIYFA
jgi:hypothetical protein